MQLERERKIEIAVGIPTVIVMLASMIALGMYYGGESGELDWEGGVALVALLVGFILLWGIVGVVIAYLTNDPPEDSTTATATTSDAEVTDGASEATDGGSVEDEGSVEDDGDSTDSGRDDDDSSSA